MGTQEPRVGCRRVHRGDEDAVTGENPGAFHSHARPSGRGPFQKQPEGPLVSRGTFSTDADLGTRAGGRKAGSAPEGQVAPLWPGHTHLPRTTMCPGLQDRGHVRGWGASAALCGPHSTKLIGASSGCHRTETGAQHRAPGQGPPGKQAQGWDATPAGCRSWGALRYHVPEAETGWAAPPQ